MSQQRAIPSPNIWSDPDLYEVENRAVDPDGAIWAAMAQVSDWAGGVVLDIGCGTGFHLPHFATTASGVIGLEPHLPLAERAVDRVKDLGGVQVLAAAAQEIPLSASSVDVVHARWAYFFGPGCEPGLAELHRVLCPGGTAFVIDNDTTRSTFGQWFRRAWADYDPAAVERFWTRHGWSCTQVDMRWQMQSRADFEAVVRLEFPAELAERLLDEHGGSGVDYAVNLWHRRF